MKFHKIPLFSLLTLPLLVSSSRIMIMTALGTRSTMLMLDNLAQLLALRGHEVVHVTKEPLNLHPVKNVSYLYLKPEVAWDEESLVKSLFKGSLSVEYPTLMWFLYSLSTSSACEPFYSDEYDLRKKFEDSGNFDLVIIDFVMQECLYPLVHTKKAPMILIHPNSIDPSISKSVSIPSPHYLRNFFTPPAPEMNFYYRTAFTLIHSAFIIIQEWIAFPAIEEIAGKYIPNSVPINEILKETSFVMGAYDGIFMDARPGVPFMENIACVTCRPAKPLPQAIAKVIDETGDSGFIIFAMGTFIKPSAISQDFLNAFLSAFAKLNQTIFWQFNKTVENLPKNVKKFDWLPNQDLLGHPNCRLFIYHGGMYSSYEAMYYGVPMVGLGALGDQLANIQLGVQMGITVALDKYNITTESVYDAINTALQPSYKARIEEISNLLKDQPQTPLERLLYWIEYVIRHKGARHLRNDGNELNFIQYFSIDVIAFLICVVFIASVIVKFLTGFILKTFKILRMFWIK